MLRCFGFQRRRLDKEYHRESTDTDPDMGYPTIWHAEGCWPFLKCPYRCHQLRSHKRLYTGLRAAESQHTGLFSTLDTVAFVLLDYDEECKCWWARDLDFVQTIVDICPGSPSSVCVMSDGQVPSGASVGICVTMYLANIQSCIKSQLAQVMSILVAPFQT